MAGKILFVEDYLDHLKGGFIVTALRNLGILEEGEELNEKSNSVVECARNFQEAVKKIINAGDGADYSWFFLDRNLEHFDDIEKPQNITAGPSGGDQIVFSKEFFQCFKGFEGDYLYFLLRKAGVPIEKICFLTANNPEESLLQSTPFVFGEKIPEVIVKSKSSAGGNQSAMNFGNDDDVSNVSPTPLEEKIRSTRQVQLRCRYSEIFKDEEKLKKIIGKGNSNKFLEVLEKIESKETCTDKEDGVVFRKIVENICMWLNRGGQIEPRTLLNNIGQKQAYCLNLKNFERALSNILKAEKFDDDDELKNLKLWLLNNDTQIKFPKALQFINNQSTKNSAGPLDTVVFLCFLNYYLQNGSGIPKYILACLDHVYTLTSEFSAHGKCDIDVNDIPWRALADDMITILKWCVAHNPPQNPKTEVTLHFDATTWSPQFFVKGTEVTLKTVKGGIQNQGLPRGTIEKVESV